jgi:signal transduction histidine kinase/DNA-binding response OmpR family regulator
MYEWSPTAEPQQGNELTVKIKYRESIPGWEECLTAGECVNNIVRNMSQAEQDQLSPQGIISILVAPITLQDEFWGFIGFDDCQQERVWDKIEADILKSAGMLIASAIQRQRSELDLIDERQTLDWVLETSPVAAITAHNGKINRLNKQGRELFAFPKGAGVLEIGKQVLGEQKNIFELGPLVREIREKGAFSRRGIQFRCVDGVIRDFLLTTVPFKPKDFRKLISWIVDITEIKETERALMQARDKAEIATKAKSDFLARMSHEIRTPMNAILGMVYLCLQTKLDEKQQDYLTKTQAAANNLLGIINDVLDFSKIEAGKIELESIPFSLKQTIDEVAGIMGMNAADKGLQLMTNVDPQMCDRLVGDPLRIRQILFNLISNAIKFTSKGCVSIAVRQDDSYFQEDSREDSNKVCITFEVRDTGIGLKPEQIETIFESFSQADGSTTRKYGGTGLGLAIVKSLVELMKGKINVTSVLGQGTTFSFSIVCTVARSDAGMFSSIILLNKRRVLLVDDNANDLEILTNLMQGLQMHVTFARTGASALEKLMEASQMRSPFELVLVDWRMPRMDGVEVIRRIRQNEDIAPPHILMISAYDRQECLRQVQGLNVTDVLNKPIQPDSLKEAMKTAFREDLSRKTNETRADIRGIKVLLVEDNKINQMVASELLKMLEVNLTIADNGLEAVEAVKNNDFDLILMDIQMPEMDGLTATQTIRNLDKLGVDKLPILAMTANAMDTDYQKSLEVGMNDHLTKPIDPEKLRLALEKWIDR